MHYQLYYYNFLCTLQEDESVQEILDDIVINQPCCIVKMNAEGRITDGQAVLIAEKSVLCKFNVQEVPMVLLSAFYVFNIHYPEGCSNFYSALEAILLQQKIPPRKPRLAAILSRLEHI